jgi:quercetin dioxygenase-like cupin family protein
MRIHEIAIAATLAFTVLAQAAAAPKVSVVPVMRTGTTITGEKIVVPQNPEVAVSVATFPPGAALPIHKHPYPHYVYVLDGVLTVTNIDTGKSFTVKKGDFIVETNVNWHYGKNDGDVPVKLLIIDQLPPGVTSNVDVKPTE